MLRARQAADAAPGLHSRNPNRARSLIVSFCMRNPAAFHRADARRLRVLGRPRDRARRDQPAAGGAPGARAGPLDAAGRAVPRARRARRSRASRRSRTLRRRARDRLARALRGLRHSHGIDERPAKNAFYAQSGGVTAVINASACGVIETARATPRRDRQRLRRPQRHHRRADRGPDRHRQGIGRGDRARCAPRPSGAFGSCRYKLKSLEKNRREYERLIEVFKAHDIGYFFYNGGGDSADTCFKVSQLSQSMGYPLQAIHVPKTVDNDLPITDCCPGFGSVAKYVAVSTLEASFDVRSMAAHLDQGVRARGDGPARRLDRRGRRPDRGPRHPGRRSCSPRSSSTRRSSSPASTRWSRSTATAPWSSPKAATTPTARFLAEQGTRDAFGHAQLGGAAPVVAQHGQEGARPQVPLGGGRLPAARGAPHRLEDRRASRPTSSASARSSWRSKGHNAVMPTIERTSDAPYRYQIGVRRPGRGGQRREVHAARLHQRRRLRHHREVPALPAAADRRARTTRRTATACRSTRR